MPTWTPQQLDAIGAADELDIAALRPDGSLRPYTIWVVRVEDELYMRSYRGADGSWYWATQRRPEGRIRAGGVEHGTTFEHPNDVDEDAIDAAYRTKYARYGRAYVDPMVAPNARATTLRLTAP